MQVSSRYNRLALMLISLALVGMAYTHVVDAKMKAQEHVWYMLGLFCCNIIASIIVLMALWLRPNAVKLWVAAGALAALTIGCFVWSRTVGFPEMSDHIGDWSDPIGIASLGFRESAWLFVP